MKQLYAFLMLSVIALFMCENAAAQSFRAKKLDYKIVNDSSVCVVGFYYYSIGDQPSVSGHFEIPKEVKYKRQMYKVVAIGDNAFRNCRGLTSITIPESVLGIGSAAFDDCSNLTSVNISESVTWIDGAAFCDCSSLTSIDIPDSVISIGAFAFGRCKSLKSVSLPKKLNSIDDNTFYDCDSLIALQIPESVTSIGEDAFKNCRSLISINIPNSVTSIGNYAFSGCESLVSVDVPKSVTSLGNFAFAYCSNLRSATLSNVVLEEGGDYFYDCSNLEEVNVVMYYANAVNTSYHYSTWNYLDYWSYRIKQCNFTMPSLEYYLKKYIEPSINAWQVKGEFEKTADWQERVSDASRKEKVAELMAELTEKYFELSGVLERRNFKSNKMELMSYDADNESYLVKVARVGDILLPVPIGQAQEFKENWKRIKSLAEPTFVPSGETMVLSAITFEDGFRKYIYDSKTKANYQITDIEYNFDPIDVGNPTGTTLAAGNGISGNAKIGTKKIEIGKSDVDVNIPVTDIRNDKTFVVIIANENYTHEKAVDYAINDGRTFSQYCQKTLGIPSRNIHIVENATYGNIVSEVSWLESVLKQIGSDAKAIFYYSGHGIPNEATGEAYLLPTDCANSNYQTAYSLSKLYSTLGETSCRSVTFFVDACFSGAERSGGMMASARGVAIKAKSGLPVGNSVLFSAASSDQTASAYNEKGHGIFTYFLLKKLQETKGKVSYGEVADYVIKQVADLTTIKNKRQTPSVVSATTLTSVWRDWEF